MHDNFGALEILVHERLTQARQTADRLRLVAQARARRRPLRVRLGEALIALGECLRHDAALAPQSS